MIAETLAGIALVKSAVDGIKSAINTARDVSDIADQIDNLFRGEQEVQKARNKKSGTRLSDQLGVDSVAREVIDAKLAQEKMQEIATLIDLRFGHGTWRGIVDERAKRIKEAKEAAAAKRREEILRQNEMIENIKICVVVVGAVFLLIGLLFAVLASVR